MPHDEEINQDLVRVIEDHFVPAANYTQASVKHTTEQVFALVERYAPGRFHASEVEPVMKRLAYKTILLGDDIVWLMRGRS